MSYDSMLMTVVGPSLEDQIQCETSAVPREGEVVQIMDFRDRVRRSGRVSSVVWAFTDNATRSRVTVYLEPQA